VIVVKSARSHRKTGALIGGRHGDASGRRAGSDGHSPGAVRIQAAVQLSPLSDGAAPQISPKSPIGEVYRYRVVGPPGYSVMDLKTLQDWVLERCSKAVPGVIDVTGCAVRPDFLRPGPAHRGTAAAVGIGRGSS
jgi:hypothetical protein